jgi:succinate-semialdehyde dehydrogenase/glutarate-semialdehyde dehydrogenase
MGMISGQAASNGLNGHHRAIPSVNPATGQVLAEVPVMGPDEVTRAVERARAAQVGWGSLSPKVRGQRVLAFRDQIVSRLDELADLLSRETGKPRPEALGHDLMSVVDLATHYAKRAPVLLRPHPIPLHLFKHRRSYLHYTPRGVIGIISPWNFPFAIPIGETVMSLLAGNAVVLKPSEVTPLVALKAKELFDASGLPADLFQVVTGDGGTGAALIDAGVDQIVFTGSVASGRKVARACGERLIPCTLELGGKAPAIVLPDADLERTARALVWGAFANSGQVCASVERVLATEPVYEPLLKRCVELTQELRQGNPASLDIDVGAICFAPQVENAKRQVEDAVQKGAKVETGGASLPGPGQFFAPTILSGVTREMKVVKEESFAPLLPFVKVRDAEEALSIANESHLGLMSYVFGKDRDACLSLAERIVSGTVMVNDVLATYGMPETPWAGLKASGLGRVHSDEGLRELCQTRHVNYDVIKPMMRELWWYPYSEGSYNLIKRGIRTLFSGGVIKGIKALLQKDEPQQR